MFLVYDPLERKYKLDDFIVTGDSFNAVIPLLLFDFLHVLPFLDRQIVFKKLVAFIEKNLSAPPARKKRPLILDRHLKISAVKNGFAINYCGFAGDIYLELPAILQELMYCVCDAEREKFLNNILYLCCTEEFMEITGLKPLKVGVDDESRDC